jgi:hypothetical protein
VAQATIPIQVPSNFDITHWMLQRTNHILCFADSLSDCLPAPLNLQESDIWAPGAFTHCRYNAGLASALSVSNPAHNGYHFGWEMLSKQRLPLGAALSLRLSWGWNCENE